MKINVAFIGLGLIGGSIAKTIKRIHPEADIIAFDLDNESIDFALSEGVISKKLELNELISTEILKKLDYLFLCAPVMENTKMLSNIKENLGESKVIITDVGSVKASFAAEAKRLSMSNVICGHPMAGSEKTGFVSSNAYMIENVYYIICDAMDDMESENLKKFKEFIAGLGAIPIALNADYHDYIMSAISHMPHYVAAALVNAVNDASEGDEIFKTLAAGGFKDITRIASSSPVMWEQIAFANKNNVLKMLNGMIDNLNDIKDSIINNQNQDIIQLFERSRSYRNSIPESGLGTINKEYRLHCDLVDEAGGIATVATILAVNNISIKNIGIIHNREYEEGVLRIEFYDGDSLSRSVELLERHKYTIYH